MNHKFSTWALLSILLILCVVIIVESIEVGDIVRECNEEEIIKVSNGRWVCSTDINQTYYYNASTTYINNTYLGATDTDLLALVNVSMLDNSTINRSIGLDNYNQSIDLTNYNSSIDLSSYNHSIDLSDYGSGSTDTDLLALVNVSMLDNSTINRSIGLDNYNQSIDLTNYNSSIDLSSYNHSIDLSDYGSGSTDTDLLALVVVV